VENHYMVFHLIDGVRASDVEMIYELNFFHFNSFCYDDDDDEEATIQVREYDKNSPVAITLDFLITDSLIMEDEHLDTISETESDEVIKSSVENLVPSPSESEDFSDIESELIFLKSIPPGIDEADCDPEEEIRLIEKLFYNNLSPRRPEEFNSKNSDAVIEDILFLEELLSNDSLSLPENESFHFDVPSSPRPPAKPPDDGSYFEPDTGVFTAKVVGDICEHYALMPRILPTQPSLLQMRRNLFISYLIGALKLSRFLLKAR
nr:hypothetical protein [Tanacetum cinerariifolium]